MAILNNLQWPLFAPGDRVLVAVSGGPDSLSLLHVLWTEREARQLGSVEAAHLDHGLRGDESAAEAEWVAAWCRERGIACHVGKADTAAWAWEHRQSTQEAARAVRYAFLEQTAAAIGADKIATAHTQDDQTETVLGNILRGTGLDGLRGIPAQRELASQRGLIVRPLIDVSRAEVEAYCAANDLQPRRDPSNFATDHYTRNRIRLELLPQLRREFNPRIDNALLRLSEIAARDSDYLATQAAAALTETTVFFGPTRLALDMKRLQALHPALLRYVLRQALAQMRGTAEGVTYSHLERLCGIVSRMTSSGGGISIDGLLPSPGCRISVFPTVLRLDLMPDVPAASLEMPVMLAVPGEAALTTGWSVKAAWEDYPGAIGLDADTMDIASLMVRNWRMGDRIDPLGMGGRHKKLSNIFTDAKVPRLERHRIPIVADSAGILWVVGHAVAERAKVTPGTTRRLFLSAWHS
jgi:tRNA(Ile)-lysidine synthase